MFAMGTNMTHRYCLLHELASLMPALNAYVAARCVHESRDLPSLHPNAPSPAEMYIVPWQDCLTRGHGCPMRPTQKFVAVTIYFDALVITMRTEYTETFKMFYKVDARHCCLAKQLSCSTNKQLSVNPYLPTMLK